MKRDKSDSKNLHQNLTLKDNLHRKDWKDNSLKEDLKIWKESLIKTKKKDNSKGMKLLLKSKFKINMSKPD